MPSRNPWFLNHSNPYCLFAPLRIPRTATADLPSAPAAALLAGKASFAVGPRFRSWGRWGRWGANFHHGYRSCMSLPCGQETPQRKHGGQGCVGQLTDLCSLSHSCIVITIQLYRYVVIQLYNAIQVYSSIVTQLYIQLYSPIDIQMYSCIVLQLYSYIDIQLYSFIVIQLYIYIYMQLHNSILM